MSSTQLWRSTTKQKMIDALGGKCVCCGYNKCNTALEFHHLNPKEKEFTFSMALASPKSWILLVEELRKCALLCANCHREVHLGITEVENKQYFNEEYTEYYTKIEMDECPICLKLKPVHNKTCSYTCAGKLRSKLDWNYIDLPSLLETYKNPEQVGKFLGVSGSAVRKRIKKVSQHTC